MPMKLGILGFSRRQLRMLRWQAERESDRNVALLRGVKTLRARNLRLILFAEDTAPKTSPPKQSDIIVGRKQRSDNIVAWLLEIVFEAT
ncbi:hypothetical protein Q31b_03140 [Novipirellula aureliae]|uniref:Uncharacterized protein n=1 Tax=Novipirellula aureliae TaxID=2527966 RepID=A0A5C6E634_9BACT|nr:hypothetical protein Q31b_03140 [Novipirellula aureliae]